MNRTKDIRKLFLDEYAKNNFVIDKTGVKMVELIGQSFIADSPAIFGEPNQEYIERELEWYISQSLYVKDIPGKVPTIWESISSSDGRINSNYGWCVWSKENYEQFNHCANELIKNPFSRRATMIYNRPSMHIDYNIDGMNDFICTYANQFFIRDNKLVSHYIMRSNDVIFGYRNDYAWAKYIQTELYNELLITYPDLELGDIIWTASSLHIYERHFNVLEEQQ
jgi:thymidylate synthase